MKIRLWICLFLSIVSAKGALANLDSAKYFEQKSEYLRTIPYYQEWLKKNALNLSAEAFDVRLALTKNYRINGFLKEGLALIEETRTLAEANNLEFFILKAKIAEGDFFRVVNRQQSLELLLRIDEKSLKKYPELHAVYCHRVAAVYNELDYIFGAAFLDSATAYSTKCLAISKRHNFSDPMATSYNELANIYEKRGDLEKSLIYYDSSSTIFQEIENLVDLINVSQNKARLYYLRAEIDEAFEILKFAIPISIANNWYWVTYRLFDIKALCYLAIGDSLNYLKAHVENLENHNLSLEYQSDIDLLTLRTEYNVREKENFLALKNLEYLNEKAQNRRLLFFFVALLFLLLVIVALFLNVQRKSKVLSNLLKENQFLLGESNHRIKNNLQLIVSLLARENLNQHTTEISKLQEVASKIDSIATLHQQLYTRDEKQSIELNEYLGEILENFQDFFETRAIKLHFSIEKIKAPIDKAMYTGLLLTELVINSLKHAFEDDTSSKYIELSVKHVNQNCVFKYADNGMGFSPNKKLKLANLLVAQIEGTSKQDSRKGFEFEMKFRL